jgi:hypothetical protein
MPSSDHLDGWPTVVEDQGTGHWKPMDTQDRVWGAICRVSAVQTEGMLNIIMCQLTRGQKMRMDSKRSVSREVAMQNDICTYLKGELAIYQNSSRKE